jgi:hypothetical protein
MSDRIIVPESGEKKEPEKEEELKYKATEEDEEKFFLMYHMNMQPSEVDRLDPDRRKWILHRYIGQRQMEKEVMDQMRIRQQIAAGQMPNFRVTD